MPKFLKETGQGPNENDYARRIRLVEECIRENEITIDIMGNDYFIRIKDKMFRLGGGSSIPRMIDDERLELWGDAS
jgi:hypothetical protein